MKQGEKILHFAQQHNGIITTKQAEELGVKRSALQSLKKSGLLFLVQRGIYITENGYADDFFLLQERYPKGVYSHETALYLLGFSDRIPTWINMTFQQGTSTSRMKKDQIVAVTIKDSRLFHRGIRTVQRPGETRVNVYEIERVLVDLVRPRYDPDMEQLLPAYRKYAESVEKDINKLFRYARQFGVEDKVRNYIGVLL